MRQVFPLPVQPCAQTLRRTQQRSVVLQLERLMAYPMVRRAVEAGALTLHGWHDVRAKCIFSMPEKAILSWLLRLRTVVLGLISPMWSMTGSLLGNE